MNRLALTLTIAASIGAAAIHFALAPHHVEELGALGFGFHLAGLVQVLLPAAAFVAWRRADRAFRSLVLAGMAANAAILGAWVVSRVVGLPAGPQPWTPEEIGIADSVTAALELVVVSAGALLLGRAAMSSGPQQKRSRWAQSLAVGPAIALIAVATSFALLSPEGVAGHGGDGHPHAPADSHAPGDAHAVGPPPTPEPSVEDDLPAAADPADDPGTEAGHGHADGEDSEPHGH